MYERQVSEGVGMDYDVWEINKFQGNISLSVPTYDATSGHRKLSDFPELS